MPHQPVMSRVVDARQSPNSDSPEVDHTGMTEVIDVGSNPAAIV